MWYKITSESKIAPNKETVFQIEYKDGTKGGFVGTNVELPKNKCVIDDTTLIYGKTVISGKCTITNSQIDSSSISVVRGATIKDSIIKNSSFNLHRLTVDKSTVENLVANKGGKEEESNAVLKIMGNSFIETKEGKIKIYLEGESQISFKQSEVSGKNICFENYNGKTTLSCSLVIPRKANSSANTGNDLHLVLCRDSEVLVKNSKFANFSEIRNEKAKLDMSSTVIGGKFLTAGGKISKSTFLGEFVLNGAASISNSKFSSCSKVLAEKSDPEKTVAKITDSYFMDSCIIKYTGSGNKKTEIDIAGSNVSGAATLLFKEKLCMVSSTIEDNAFIIDGGTFVVSTIKDSAVVCAKYILGCSFSGTANIGCDKKCRPIKNAKKIMLDGCKSNGRYDSFCFDYQKGALILFGNNKVYFCSDKRHVSLDDSKKALDGEMFQLKRKCPSRTFEFQFLDNKCEEIVSEIKKQMISKDIPENIIYSFVRFVYWHLIDQIVMKNDVCEEQKDIYEDLKNFCRVDIKSGKIVFVKTKMFSCKIFQKFVRQLNKP